MVKIAISRGIKLQGLETDFVKSLVINAESLVRVLDELMHRQCSVVRLRK